MKRFAEAPLNPLADQLKAMSIDLIQQIEETADAATEIAQIEFVGFKGFTRADEGDRNSDEDGFRTATNDECETVLLAWTLIGTDIRVSHPLPPQVANGLRHEAEQMLKAAAAIELMEDTRDLEAIKEMIAGASGKVVTA